MRLGPRRLTELLALILTACAALIILDQRGAFGGDSARPSTPTSAPQAPEDSSYGGLN